MTKITTSEKTVELILGSAKTINNDVSPNARHIGPTIVFYEKGQTLDALEFDIVQVNGIGDFLEVAGLESDGLCGVDIFDILKRRQ